MSLQLHPTEPPTPPRYAVILAPAASFHPLDWTVLAVYMLLVIAMGVFLGRKHRGADEFFLAGRSMPMWAVAISVLATSQSAATFVGGPQQAYDGNLTYFSANLGALLAVVLVAIFFIPAYYRQNVTSVYELIGHHYGATSQRLASGMFIVGRVFASGARLFIVAIPFALIAFGDISTRSMIGAIVIIAAAAAAYTLAGGIRAVIWTDVVQAIVYIACIVFALALVWQKIPLSFGEIIDTLRQGADGDKLTIVDLRLDSTKDLAKPYGFWAIIIGLTLFNLAAFGTDQDLTQRMLTCRSARHGSWSVIIANLIGWPVVFMFLCMGLLLYVYYQQPDVMGAAAVDYQIDDTRKVFLEFILHEMPLGLRGLMLAGLFAAAMSSTDSALNAMASTTVADFYRPLTSDRSSDPAFELKVARLAVLFWALVLGAFACFCVYWQKASEHTLIDFALNVMVFAYSGLLAVFCTALFTKRGNAVSVAASLATGFLCVLLLQDFAWKHWAPWFNIDFTLAFPWKMLLATLLSFVVCYLGKRTPPPSTVDSPS